MWLENITKILSDRINALYERNKFLDRFLAILYLAQLETKVRNTGIIFGNILEANNAQNLLLVGMFKGNNYLFTNF